MNATDKARLDMLALVYASPGTARKLPPGHVRDYLRINGLIIGRTREGYRGKSWYITSDGIEHLRRNGYL